MYELTDKNAEIIGTFACYIAALNAQQMHVGTSIQSTIEASL